jgi:hypothetical protein
MAVEARIAELNHRHAKLEQNLTNELGHPSSDDTVITKLKREKLRLKEEIERLKREPA